MNKKGQALIEFILILPVVLFFLLAVFDYVNILSSKSQMTSSIENYLVNKDYNVSEYDVKSTKNDDLTKYEFSKNVDITSPILSAVLGTKYKIVVSRSIYE